MAPISYLLFLTVLLPTNENEKNNRFNAGIVVANYCFGTWNIGTLKGKSGEVCKVLRRRKVTVCCIQEVRWKGESSRALQGYKLMEREQ